MRRSVLAGAVLAVVLGLGATTATAAERVCGSVRSGGAPVRGAHVLASKDGVVATTDSLGGFCLEGIAEGTLRLQVFALGFQPGERLATVGPGMGPVYLELVPLRGSSAGWSADAGAAAAPPAPPAAAPPATAAAKPRGGLTGDEDAGTVFLARTPMLVLAADSAWLVARHKGAHWDTLLVLHDALTRPAGGPGAVLPATWRRLSGRVHDLQVGECDLERPRKRALGDAPCAFLARAAALLEARRAMLERRSPSRDARIFLERLARAGDPRAAAWATDLLEKSRPTAAAR